MVWIDGKCSGFLITANEVQAPQIAKYLQFPFQCPLSFLFDLAPTAGSSLKQSNFEPKLLFGERL